MWVLIHSYCISHSGNRLQNRMAAVRKGCTHLRQRELTGGQGTALSIAFEPILCCRLFLSTHDTVRGRRNDQSEDWVAGESVPLQVEARKKLHLDSMGYPNISGAYSLLPLCWFTMLSAKALTIVYHEEGLHSEHLTNGHLP